MKVFKQGIIFSNVLFIFSFLTGCAAGSATAGYALKAREADHLTADGEERITNRIKREIMFECSESEAISSSLGIRRWI